VGKHGTAGAASDRRPHEGVWPRRREIMTAPPKIEYITPEKVETR